MSEPKFQTSANREPLYLPSQTSFPLASALYWIVFGTLFSPARIAEIEVNQLTKEGKPWYAEALRSRLHKIPAPSYGDLARDLIKRGYPANDADRDVEHAFARNLEVASWLRENHNGDAAAALRALEPLLTVQHAVDRAFAMLGEEATAERIRIEGIEVRAGKSVTGIFAGIPPDFFTLPFDFNILHDTLSPMVDPTVQPLPHLVFMRDGGDGRSHWCAPRIRRDDVLRLARAWDESPAEPDAPLTARSELDARVHPGGAGAGKPDRPAQEHVAGNDRLRGRAPPPSYRAADDNLLIEMNDLVAKGMSRTAASIEVAGRAEGGGTEESRAKRLQRRYAEKYAR